MNRKEERNMIAHEIAWQHTKHYDPLLSKESWCEMAAREAIDLADRTMIEKACRWLKDNIDHYAYNKDFVSIEDFIKSFRKTMEE